MSNRSESRTNVVISDIKSRAAQTDLETLRLPELQARFAAVVGETSKSPNRTFLIRRIEEALATQAQPAAEQERGVSGGTEPSVAHAEPSTPDAEEPAPRDAAEFATEPGAEEPNDAEVKPEGTCPTNGSDCEPTGTEAAAESTALVKESAEENGGIVAAPAAEGAPADGELPEGVSLGEVKERRPRGRFAAMSIADLQAMYTEKVGRSTDSEHRGYLMWKIREAEKGRITVGPVQARTRTGEPREMKVLPLSLELTTVEKMDAAWRAKGIKTRMDFLRKAIGSYLTQLGATEEAALFAGE